MRLTLKNTLLKRNNRLNKKSFLPMVLALALLLGSLPATTSAANFQAQIDALNRQIRSDQDSISQLREQRDTLNNRLAALRAEQEQLRSKIKKTELDIKQTNQELKDTEAEIAKQRQILQENARTVYKNGTPSTVEILFSSSNFSEFISKQEYLSSAREAVDEAAKRSTTLKEQLEGQKARLDKEMAELRSQRSALAAKEQEQQRLIAETRGEERRYQNMVSSNTAERSRLEAQQRAAYAAAAAAARNSGQFVASAGSGYPWAVGPYPCWSANCVDPWGLYYRECVSYTAWKVASTGRFVPHFGGAGHARQWPATAAAHGIPNGTTPRAGSVAISYMGVFGHSMYVEEVLDGGARIRISEYNFMPGAYTERIIPSSGLTYIYF